MATSWEYRVRSLDLDAAAAGEPPAALAEAGVEGWELVSVVSSNSMDGYELIAFLKRPLEYVGAETTMVGFGDDDDFA